MTLCNGKRIRQYRWENGSKKILFVHGWQRATYRWKQYIELLAQNPEYTLLSFDAPAHGQSEGKQFTVLGLIIHDQKDGLTDFSNARLLHQYWPQAELMTTTGLGHRLRSPEVIKAVVDFIK